LHTKQLLAVLLLELAQLHHNHKTAGIAISCATFTAGEETWMHQHNLRKWGEVKQAT
jgi:hypothetical protein